MCCSTGAGLALTRHYRHAFAAPQAKEEALATLRQVLTISNEEHLRLRQEVRAEQQQQQDATAAAALKKWVRGAPRLGGVGLGRARQSGAPAKVQSAGQIFLRYVG